MLDRLMRERPRGRKSNKATPQVVIMAPTRELVTQTDDEADKLVDMLKEITATTRGP